MKVKMTVFYPDGYPDGVVSITDATGSGKAVVFPRQSCLDVCRNPDYKDIFERPYIYVLWRPGTGNQKPMAYVGESPTASNRITRHYHDKNKAFWTRAVVYADKNGNMSTSHIEGMLLQCAEDAKVCNLDNEKKRRNFNQGDADAAVTQIHLSGLTRFFLPLAGCDFFRLRDSAVMERKPQVKIQTQKPASVVAVLERPELKLTVPRKGISAYGRETDEGFLVYKGSQAAKKESSVLQKYNSLKRFIPMRQELRKDKTLVDDKGNSEVFLFSRDYLFTSPSAAAVVIMGANANGRTAWKDATNKKRTLKDLQEQRG